MHRSVYALMGIILFIGIKTWRKRR